MNGLSQADPSAIVLQRMPQQLEATGRGDDWTGVTDAATRRRLQNRHAQRTWRKKKQQRQRQASSSTPPSLPEAQVPDSAIESIQIRPEQIACYMPGRVCRNMLPGAQARLDFYAQRAYTEYMLHAPRPAALHLVVQLNVMHALVQNAATLQIKPPWLDVGDSLSPFNRAGPAELSINLPSSLKPTKLQTTTRHRSWIDLFPLPELRDVFLRLSWTTFENDLSTDLLDVDETVVSKPSLVVWGDSADPKAWEATVPFLKKWGWLVKGCKGLIESTNHWRERRGDRRIVFEVD